MRLIFLLAVLLPVLAFGETPPPPILYARTLDGAGNAITSSTASSKRGLDVHLIDTSGLALDASIQDLIAKFTTTANGLKVDGSAVTQPISAVSLPLPSLASTSTLQTSGNASLTSIDGKLASLGQKAMAGSVPVVIASDQSTVPVSGTVTTSPDVNVHDGSANALTSTLLGGSKRSLDVNVANTAAILVDGSGSTQPVSGTVAVSSLPAIPTGSNVIGSVSQNGAWTTGRTWSLSTGSDSVNAAQSGSWTAGRTWTLSSGTDSVAAAQSGAWNITNISGTVSLPTGAATESSLVKLPVTQGSTTSGQSGPLVQGAVTTAAPSYTTAQTSPLSLTTAGALRTDVSGTVTANQGGAPWSENQTQINGVAVSTGNGTVDTGTQRVAIASNNTAFSVNAAQSGTWNINNVSGTVSLPTGAALDASVTTVQGTVAAGTAATKSELSGGVYNSTLPTLTNGQQAATQVDTKGRILVGPNTSGSHTTGNVSTVITLTAPANAAGFLLQASDANGANMRWAVGSTATTSLGNQLQPGRDTGYVPMAADISIVSESGTNEYQVQWIVTR